MSIQTAYTSYSNFPEQSKQLEEKTLGAICFIDCSEDNNAVKMPAIQLHASILDGLYAACEIWLSNANLGTEKALNTGSSGDISYRLNDEFLFGVITSPESIPSEIDGDISPLQFTTESAYSQIFALMEKMNYTHIYRFWNYMEDINGVSHGLERYRQFNVGRKAAFLASNNTLHNQLPAACALGLAHGPLNIAFLVGRQAPIAIENPRQISAYEYPEEYGPETPTFSRATLLHSEQATLLFISGTASIVGHQTLHTTDVVAQTKETLINLEAVIAEANRTIGEVKFDLKDVFLRVYVRHAADLSLIKNEMQRYLGRAMNAVFIQADVCRQELLLEIEATAKCSTESSPSKY